MLRIRTNHPNDAAAHLNLGILHDLYLGDGKRALDQTALDALLQYGLMLVDAIDADLARSASGTSRAAPATA